MIPWTTLSAICQSRNDQATNSKTAYTKCGDSVRHSAKPWKIHQAQSLLTKDASLEVESRTSAFGPCWFSWWRRRVNTSKDGSQGCRENLPAPATGIKHIQWAHGTHLHQQLPVEPGSPNAATSSAFYLLPSYSPR